MGVVDRAAPRPTCVEGVVASWEGRLCAADEYFEISKGEWSIEGDGRQVGGRSGPVDHTRPLGDLGECLREGYRLRTRRHSRVGPFRSLRGGVMVATIRTRICCGLSFWWTSRSEESGGSEEVSDSAAVGHAVDVDGQSGFHVDVASRHLSGGAVTDIDSCCAGVIFDEGVVPVVVSAVSEKRLYRLLQVEAGGEVIAVFGEVFGKLVGFLDIAADDERAVGGEGGLPAVFNATAQSSG